MVFEVILNFLLNPRRAVAERLMRKGKYEDLKEKYSLKIPGLDILLEVVVKKGKFSIFPHNQSVS